MLSDKSMQSVFLKIMLLSFFLVFHVKVALSFTSHSDIHNQQVRIVEKLQGVTLNLLSLNSSFNHMLEVSQIFLQHAQKVLTNQAVQNKMVEDLEVLENYLNSIIAKAHENSDALTRLERLVQQVQDKQKVVTAMVTEFTDSVMTTT